jgi:hypothetical protein
MRYRRSVSDGPLDRTFLLGLHSVFRRPQQSTCVDRARLRGRYEFGQLDEATWTAPQTFAVVASGAVTRVVTGLPATISAQYPGAIRIDKLNPVPDVGWTYDGTTFTAPSK